MVLAREELLGLAKTCQNLAATAMDVRTRVELLALADEYEFKARSAPLESLAEPRVNGSVFDEEFPLDDEQGKPQEQPVLRLVT
ncbi:hypothetical protein [Sphingomicrobium arenosum]|uniref:hypothetical protein n=1 Tax=Sphingomicrobium arenosum TaxID=2233861 RepID=UPI00223EB236|nr:hypothetical protein [Sphingomicrobium arenosum]